MSETPDFNFSSYLEWNPDLLFLLASFLITLWTASSSKAPSLTKLQHFAGPLCTLGWPLRLVFLLPLLRVLLRASQGLFGPLHHSGLDSKFTFFRGFFRPVVSVSLSWRLQDSVHSGYTNNILISSYYSAENYIKCFIFMISFTFQNHLMRHSYHPYFAGEETEAKRSETQGHMVCTKVWFQNWSS